MENHAVDIPWWGDLVSGPSKPIIQDGYIPVPDTPGLGVELNEDVVKEHLRKGCYFEPTPQYDDSSWIASAVADPIGTWTRTATW